MTKIKIIDKDIDDFDGRWFFDRLKLMTDDIITSVRGGNYTHIFLTEDTIFSLDMFGIEEFVFDGICQNYHVGYLKLKRNKNINIYKYKK